MYQGDTEDLEAAFRAVETEQLNGLLQEKKEEFLPEQRDFMNYMNQKFREKRIHKQKIFLLADIPQGYGYKLLTEEKTTQKRDVIIRICYVAGFSVKELQQALRLYQMTPLYARRKRDACLISCFEKQPGDLQTVNQILAKAGLAPLASAGVQD